MELLKLRRTNTGRYPKALDAIMPFRGPCGFCGGPDARHRIVEAAQENLRAGESPASVAENYPELKSLIGG